MGRKRIVSLLTLIPLMAILASCGGTRTITETEIKRVDQPVLFCPKPPEHERPKLAIHSDQVKIPDNQTWKSLPNKQKYKIVKAYKATIKELLDYSQRLEGTLDDYTEMSKDMNNINQMMKFQKPGVNLTNTNTGEQQ